MLFNRKQMLQKKKMVKDGYRTKNLRFNTLNTMKNRITIQQTQTDRRFNSPKKVLKRSKSRTQQQSPPPKPNGNRNILPSIPKKPILPTYTPAPSRIRTPPSTIFSETSSSILTRLPPIKDHVLKDNLALKPTLKCKTPRPDSAHRRSSAMLVVEFDEQTKTRHPLQRFDVASLLTESARNRLKRLFKKLDTDQDGHLLYTQVQRCLPPNLPRAQLTFFHVLYNIISDGTFFGLQEFYAIAVIVELVAKQDAGLWNNFLDDVDFNYYHEHIVQLIEEFNIQCLANRGTITHENLLQLIIKRTANDRKERISNELEYLVPKIKTMKINPLDFLALIPAIIYIQSCFHHERALFRFRDHSLLDLHIRQALLT